MSRPATVSVLIPAHNESATVGAVVRAALAAGLGEVIVIDDGSQDDSAGQARAAGAQVLRLDPNRGKGGAVLAGLAASTGELVVLLDADLIGLTPAHVRALSGPLLQGRADASVGLFTGARLGTTLASWLTRNWSGQRALHRAALQAVADTQGAAELRYALELAITRQLRLSGARVQLVRLPNLTHRTKEEKLGPRAGSRARLGMFRQLARYRLRRR